MKTLEKRVSALELATVKLGQANQLTNEVMTDIATELPDEIRRQIHQEVNTRTKEIESDVIAAVDGMIKGAIIDTLDERGLTKYDADRLAKARNKRMCELLGSPDSDRYKLYIRFYHGRMRNMYLKQFDVMRYADISSAQFTEALNFIQNWTMDDDSWCTDILHETYRNDEFPNNKMVHAYERYFNIA